MSRRAKIHKQVLDILEALESGSRLDLASAQVLIEAVECFSYESHKGFMLCDDADNKLQPEAHILKGLHRTAKQLISRADIERPIHDREVLAKCAFMALRQGGEEKVNKRTRELYEKETGRTIGRTNHLLQEVLQEEKTIYRRQDNG